MRNALIHMLYDCALLYSMAPQVKGAIGLHHDKESIDRSKPGNVLPFCHLFEIRTMNESFTHVQGYCCCDQAASNVGKIRFTRMANSFARPRQN